MIAVTKTFFLQTSPKKLVNMMKTQTFYHCFKENGYRCKFLQIW